MILLYFSSSSSSFQKLCFNLLIARELFSCIRSVWRECFLESIFFSFWKTWRSESVAKLFERKKNNADVHFFFPSHTNVTKRSSFFRFADHKKNNFLLKKFRYQFENRTRQKPNVSQVNHLRERQRISIIASSAEEQKIN